MGFFKNSADDNQAWVRDKVGEKFSKQEQEKIKAEARELARAREEMRYL